MMRNVTKFSLLAVMALAVVTCRPAFGKCEVMDENCLVGVQGYDPVSYQDGHPLKGNGHNVAIHDEVVYIFANASNKRTFMSNPEKYIPAYGGFCAYGVAVGKKLVGDPMVWHIVNGKLYLNLDRKVQQLWEKDMESNIQKADRRWPDVQEKSVS